MYYLSTPVVYSDKAGVGNLSHGRMVWVQVFGIGKQ